MDQSTTKKQLREIIRTLAPAPEHPALVHMVASLKKQFGEHLAAVLFYGSCLRNGDPYDGLVDLYLIVDNYNDANTSRIKAAWNWLLPPNVFYAEFPFQHRTVRCKYALLTCSDLRKGTSRRWFHSYLWGRFSQPTALAYFRDQAARDLVEQSLAQAVVTFLDRILPSLPGDGSVTSLWNGGLQLSYRAELRAEKPGRSRELILSNHDYYQRVTCAATSTLRYPIEINNNYRYITRIPRYRRLSGRLGWVVRIIQGKFLSLARLIKALFTFDGGLDYIAWKLERHSGQRIDIPPRVRRHPLIFVWGLFWQLYRRGIFR